MKPMPGICLGFHIVLTQFFTLAGSKINVWNQPLQNPLGIEVV